MGSGFQRKGSGLIIGRFLPPNIGHQFLIDFARASVDRLTILVCTSAVDEIPGALRAAWIHEMAPRTNVVEILGENIHDLDMRFDYLFGSSEFSAALADAYGARYVPVDHASELTPYISEALSRNPLAHWQYLPDCVRGHYALRVSIFGPESTGKSRLARDLAAQYQTVYISEYARGYVEQRGNVCEESDAPIMVRGQIAGEEAMARRANRILFCDTDPLITELFCEVLYARCPAWIHEETLRRRYDLTLLLDTDVPWEPDPQRCLGTDAEREDFLRRCGEALTARGRRFVRISGSWEERFSTACAAVDALLSERMADHQP